MNPKYLETLPEIENTFGLDLQEDERLIYAARLDMLGTEKGELISAAGYDCYVFLTTRNLIVDNGAGIWPDRPCLF